MRLGRGTVAAGLLLGAVGLAALPISGSAATAAAVPSAAMESGSLSCAQLEALWQEAGGSPSAAFTAAEVARAESGGRQYATDNNSNGSTDRGYWQINSTWGAESTYDALGNAKAAVAISDNGTNWSPWVTYQHGAQNGQC